VTGRRGWVLVTGASRGIGEATAMALAVKGFDLILWARTAEALATTASQISATGARVRTASVDVGSADHVSRAAAASLGELDWLAGLVLNAGGGVWSPLDRLDPAEWDDTIRTNLSGAYHVLHQVLPQFTAQAAGLIVGMLSDSVLYPFPERAAYTAAKSGMNALLEVTRREVRSRGIRVSTVLPSRVDTFFHGGHKNASPGTRKGALSAADVAQVVAGLFELPANIEVRSIHMAAMTSTYGPFTERVEP
jgi:serine 3-dehydrogenase